MESLAVFVFCLVISGSSLVFALNCAGIDQRDRMPCMLSNPNISTCMGMGCCWSGGSADPRMKCFTKKGGKCIKYESASCKVMLNTTLVPYRETPRFIENQLGVMVTERFLQLVQDVIQKYVNDDKECQQILAPMLCHYTLPPCKPDGTIRPFCQEDCVAIFKRCKKPLDEVIGAVKYISSSQNMNFIHTVFPNCSKYKPSSKYDMSSNDSCVQTGYFIKVPPGRPNITITESEIQAVSVIIRWTKPVSDGGSVVTGYKVWINTTQPPREKLTKQTHANLAGLKKNTRYTVKVYAGNVAGYGDPAVASFTTKKQGAPSLPILSYNITTGTSVTLYWTKPDENGGEITKYTIYMKERRKNGQQARWTKVNDVTATSVSMYEYRVENLVPGHSYTFMVTATNKFDESKGNAITVPLPNIKTTISTITTPASTANHTLMTHTGEHQIKLHVAGFGILIAFVASLLLNVCLIFIICKNKSKVGSKSTEKESERRKAQLQLRPPETVFDNACELEECAPPSTAASRYKVFEVQGPTQRDIPDEQMQLSHTHLQDKTRQDKTRQDEAA